MELSRALLRLATFPAARRARARLARSRIVVYTAIFGGKNRLWEPAEGSWLQRLLYRSPAAGVDFVCFTDDAGLRSRLWEIRVDAGDSRDARAAAKRFKILPHEQFPDHQASLWLDGNYLPAVDVAWLVERYLRAADVAVFAHPDRTCVYQEARACVGWRLDDRETIVRQMERYRADGYPQDNGLAACCVILRRHNDRVRAAMEHWWDEIRQNSIRDQLSFDYVMHRRGCRYDVLPGHRIHNRLFWYRPHAVPNRFEWNEPGALPFLTR